MEGSDDKSGVAGYDVLINKVPVDQPLKASANALPNSITLDDGDGDYYAHVATKDNAGNWTNTLHLGPWKLDTTAPAAPGLNAVTTPTNETPQTLTGTKDADTSVWLNGEEIVSLDTETTWAFDLDLFEGDNPLSLVTKDQAGNTSDPTVDTILFDTVPPLDPELDTANPAIGVFTSDNTIDLEWVEGSDDKSGVAGYDVLINKVPVDQPLKASANALPNSITLDDGDGDYYAHVATKDNAGNWTSTLHLGPWKLDTTAPAAPGLNAVTTPTNETPQTLTGTKDADTSVWLNGEEIVPLDTETTWAFDLDLFEGDNPLSLVTKDQAGNTSDPTVDTILYDTVPPLDPELDTANPAIGVFTSDNTIDLEWVEGSDDKSGVAGYDVLINKVPVDQPLKASANALPNSITLDDGDGDYYAHVATKDNAGNWTSTLHLGPWKLDTTAPAAPGLNAVTTPTNETPQTLTGTKDADTSVWLNGLEIVPLDTETTWAFDLDLLEGDNPLSLVTKDQAGNTSDPTVDTILFDTVPPLDPELDTANPAIGVFTSDNTIDLEWVEGSDDKSGVAGYDVLINKVPVDQPLKASSNALPNSITLDDGDGDYYAHVATKDNAGNWTSTLHLGPWKLDTTAPAAPGLNAVTTPTNETLQTLTGTKDADTSVWLNGEEIVPLDTETTWAFDLDLLEGDNPLSLVTKDQAGNTSDPTVDTILYDTVPPLDPELDTANPAIGVFTSDNTIDLEWVEGSDDKSGVAGYDVLINKVPVDQPLKASANALPNSITLDDGDGDYYAHVATKDNAGNWTNTLHLGPWKLDTTAPAAPGLNAVTTPTNETPQTLTGTKDADTSVWLNGEEIVPLDSETTWVFDLDLFEGDNPLSLVTKDQAGNTSDPTVDAILFDTVPPLDPELDTANPAIGVFTSDNTIDLEWVDGSDDKSGVAGYDVLINKVPVDQPLKASSNALPNSITLDDGDGDYYAHVATKDNAGNWTSTLHLGPWKLDTTAPAAPGLNAVTTPTNETPQTLTGTKDADTSVWLNGEEIVPLDTETTWAFDLDLLEGDNPLSLVTKDQAGNTSDPTVDTILFDTVPPLDPELDTANPAIGVFTSDNTIDLEWVEGSDDKSGVAGYDVLINKVPVDQPLKASANALPNSITLDDGDGDYYAHVATKDNAGNWTSTLHLGPWKLDTTAPAAPGLNAVTTPTNETPQTLTGTKDADTSVWLNGLEIVPLDSETTWAFDLDLFEGDNPLSLVTKDQAGNTSDPTVDTILFDTVPPLDPELDTANPAIGVFTSDNTIDLEWVEGSDDKSGVAGYDVLINKVPVDQPLKASANALPNSITLDDGDGDYYAHVATKDNAGNWTNTLHLGPWKLDTTAPEAPGLNAVTTPTNETPQTLTGTKDADTSVWLNGEEIVPLDTETTWAFDLDLLEGDNPLSLVTKDQAGNTSDPTVDTILFDTVPPLDPELDTANPAIGVFTSDNTIDLEWVEGSDDKSGVAGYDVLINKVPVDQPLKASANALPNSITLDDGDGDYYAHVATKDNAGNWTNTLHLGPWKLDTTAPAAPGLNAVTTPTNETPQTLTGTKDADTSVWLNGEEIVSLDTETHLGVRPRPSGRGQPPLPGHQRPGRKHQ